MIVEVDVASAVPPYEQLRSQIVDLVAVGSLPVGARLPAIRQLAGDLGLAPGTVARAYRELEIQGVVVSRVRHGTTVVAQARPSRQEAGERLADAAHAYAVAVRSLAARRDEAIEALDRELGALPPPP